MTGRYAIYYAPPPGSPWHAFGSRWLGRDAAGARAVPLQGEYDTVHAARTAEPRRYGWHATLKAPFRPRCSGAHLLDRVDALARGLVPVSLGALVPVPLAGFAALVATAPGAPLQDLAARCVIELDDLREPPTQADLARRRPDTLDARGRELMARYGYPYVLDRFRFHMTLTGPLQPGEAAAVVAQVAPVVGRLNLAEPPVVDRLCVFHEPGPGAPFVRIHDAELAA